MKYEAVFFDYDGTVADSIADIAYAANRALREKGLPERDAAEYRAFAGKGARTPLRRAAPAGTDGAALLMMAVMLPFFFVAMYEKDGVPAEKYVMQMIRMKFVRPGIRRYRAENIYERLKRREMMEREVKRLEEKKKAGR